MNHINVKIPIFGDRCHLLWPYTKKEADEWLKKKGYDSESVDPINCTAFTTYSAKKGNGAAIFLKEWKGDAFSISVLVHEIVHAASFIRQGIGVDETPETAEVLCYLTDHLTLRFLRSLGHK